MRKTTKIFLAATIFCMAFFVAQTALAADWSATTLDSEGYVGQNCSIAADSADKVHISYYDNGNTSLKYATNASGSWVVSTIDDGSGVGIYSSIAVDSNDKIHIAYSDTTSGELKYATNAAGAWGYQTLTSGGVFNDIAIDSNNKIHISHYIGAFTKVVYITNASSSWQTSEVETLAITANTSIDVDSNQKAYVSYYDGTNSLRYATNVSGSWQAETLDTGGVGESPSIAVDSNNKVHISYYDAGVHALSYITNISGSWVESTVDTTVSAGGLTGQYSHIALDKNNKVHISYREFYPTYSIKYATNVSGSWEKNMIAQGSSGNINGPSNSIAVDSHNRAHICYQNSSNGDLKYLYTPGPSSAAITTSDYANAVNAQLTLSASGDPTQMIISENLDFSGADWEDYAATKSFTLSSGDGLKTIYAKFRDVWYAESDAISAHITLDTVAPVTKIKPKSNIYSGIKKIKLTATDSTSGVDKIYYTTNGATPTTSSSVYTSRIVLSKDTVLKYFAVDKAGNQEAVKSTRYIIKRARFVTKSAKSSEVLVKKKNVKNYANDVVFSYVLFPAKFKKTKYYHEFERLKKYPVGLTNAKKTALKKYWVIGTNSYLYKGAGYKVKMVFQYTNKEVKALQKKNHSAKEKNLELKFYNVQTKKWESAAGAGKVSHSLKQNSFTTTATQFYIPSYTLAIGLK